MNESCGPVVPTRVRVWEFVVFVFRLGCGGGGVVSRGDVVAEYRIGGGFDGRTDDGVRACT